MFTDPLTLNANAFTGVSLAVPHALTSIKDNATLRSVASLVYTTPQVLDMRHQEYKKGKVPYARSTIGLTRSRIPATDTLLGMLGYSVRTTIDRPLDGIAVTDAMVCTMWGELQSVFGVSLSVGGVPTAAVQKFFAREP